MNVMHSSNQEALTQSELISIFALVDLLAHEKGFNRENTYYLLETEFRVRSINDLKRGDLDRAIAFLVDLQDLTIH
jgi:hypothetical protein